MRTEIKTWDEYVNSFIVSVCVCNDWQLLVWSLSFYCHNNAVTEAEPNYFYPLFIDQHTETYNLFKVTQPVSAEPGNLSTSSGFRGVRK